MSNSLWPYCLPVHQQLQELAQIHVHRVSNAIQPSHPLPSSSPPAFDLFQHQGESVLHIRWPKYWCFSFSISPSNEYSGLISFRMDWLDLLAVHEIKRRLLLGRKVMTNLDSLLKSRDITLLTNVHLVNAMVFPVVMYECESWTIKRTKCWRIDAFELWCWRRLFF